jgi:ABC-type transport system involved in cytochrome bd biosynthesis fused ATPase/permease subunit
LGLDSLLAFEIQFTHRPDMDSTSSNPIIDARNLTRIYALGGNKVIGINTVDLSVDAGELVVLKGDSGSGKSTLLSLLAGLDRPTRGELTVAFLKMPACPDYWPVKTPTSSPQRQRNCWTGLVSAGGGITCRLSFPAVRCSAQRLPER